MFASNYKLWKKSFVLPTLFVLSVINVIVFVRCYQSLPKDKLAELSRREKIAIDGLNSVKEFEREIPKDERNMYNMMLERDTKKFKDELNQARSQKSKLILEIFAFWIIIIAVSVVIMLWMYKYDKHLNRMANTTAVN